MERSKRLKPVQEIADNREQAAAQRMLLSEAEWRRQQERLDELNCYRAEYSHHFEQSCSTGIDSVRLQDYRRFLSNINIAIEQQRRVVAVTQKKHQADKQVWLDLRTKAKAIDKAVQRIREKEAQIDERQEQRLLDDSLHGMRIKKED